MRYNFYHPILQIKKLRLKAIKELSRSAILIESRGRIPIGPDREMCVLKHTLIVSLNIKRAPHIFF